MAAKIRKATEADVPRILEIEKASFRRRPYGVNGFREAFKYKQSLMVVVDGKRIVAFANWTWSPNVGPRGSSVHVHIIATDPAERRKGHAARLLGRCIANARKVRDHVELISRVSNTDAHALFEAHGFTSAPKPNWHYPDGEAALDWKLSFTGARARAR